MSAENKNCLINESACGRIEGNPVCPKCGMDERVVYPGYADLEAAQSSAHDNFIAHEERERNEMQRREVEKARSEAERDKKEREDLASQAEFQANRDAQKSELDDGRQVKMIKRIRNGWLLSSVVAFITLIVSLFEILLGHDLVFRESMEGVDHFINFSLVVAMLLLSFGLTRKNRIAGIVFFLVSLANSIGTFYALLNSSLDSLVSEANVSSLYFYILTASFHAAIIWIAFNAMRSCIAWGKYSYAETLSETSMDQGLHVLSIFLCMTVLPVLTFTIAASAIVYLKNFWFFFLLAKILVVLIYFASLSILWHVGRWRAIVAFGLVAYFAFFGIVEFKASSILRANLIISISGLLVGFALVIWETFFQARVGVYLYGLLPEGTIIGKIIRWELHPKFQHLFRYHVLLAVFIFLIYVVVE
ncbi:hypothetical protein [Rhodoferax sp.]|jgi:hypothetical protein|uniref:hypothetical protein n=1 Tax=Rhodoferax sp. TaxID=50421 RepID=UPI003784D63E